MDTAEKEQIEEINELFREIMTPILKHPSLPEGVYNKLKNNLREHLKSYAKIYYDMTSTFPKESYFYRFPFYSISLEIRGKRYVMEIKETEKIEGNLSGSLHSEVDIAIRRAGLKLVNSIRFIAMYERSTKKFVKIIREYYDHAVDVAYFSLYYKDFFGGVVAAIDRGMKDSLIKIKVWEEYF